MWYPKSDPFWANLSYLDYKKKLSFNRFSQGWTHLFLEGHHVCAASGSIWSVTPAYGMPRVLKLGRFKADKFYYPDYLLFFLLFNHNSPSDHRVCFWSLNFWIFYFVIEQSNLEILILQPFFSKTMEKRMHAWKEISQITSCTQALSINYLGIFNDNYCGTNWVKFKCFEAILGNLKPWEQNGKSLILI